MSRTILLADDSITIHKVVELTFQSDDVKVAAFSNGDDALEKIEALAPDLVIADIHMPGADGYEVARRVKAGAPQTPVLLLVGTFEPFEESEVEASGADGFLMKPFDSQELLSRVDELLEAPMSDGDSAVADESIDLPPAEQEPEPVEAPEVSAGERRATGQAVVEPSAEAVAPAPPPEPVESDSAGGPAAGLSDEEIDRIARRVVAAITPEIVREVAREVVPQIAEIVVKERIQQLEQEVE